MDTAWLTFSFFMLNMSKNIFTDSVKANSLYFFLFDIIDKVYLIWTISNQIIYLVRIGIKINELIHFNFDGA